MQLLQPFFLKKIILLGILSCCTLIGYSQLYNKIENINTDSLIKLLPELSENEKTQIYFKLAEHNYLHFPDIALAYSDTAMKLSQETKDNELIAFASYYHGKAYYFLGQYDKAISIYLPAFQYAKDSKNIKLMILLDEALVFAYFYSGNKDVTKKHLEEIETHLRYLPDNAYLAHFTIGLGYFYRYVGLYEKSIFYFQKYQELYRAHPMNPAVLALSYTHLGYCYEQLGKFDNALKCYQDDIEISDSLNLNTRSYLYLGDIYQKLDSTTKAIKCYKNAIQYYDKNGNVYYKSLSSLALGKIYLELDNFHDSKQYMEQALLSVEWIYEHKMLFNSRSYEINTFYTALQLVDKYKEEEALKLISNIHYQLFQLYSKQKQTEKALQEYIAFHEAYEKSNASERITTIEEIKDKYEAEQKDQQIKLMSQQNALNEIKVKQSRYLLFGLSGLVILIVTFAILLIRQNKLKTRQDTILLRQKLLRSQMNPHFIFNALSNISNLIDKNDNTTASKYLNRFSKLVRHILESTRTDYIDLDQEIANLENYLALQKLRFNDKFNYQIEIDNQIDPETIEIPPMLIQPFVENAIEHGIKPKETNGHLDIRFKMKGKQLICEIDDDGIGRKKSAEMKIKSHQSLATSITEERLKNFSRKFKQKISLEIIDLKTETNVSLGTRVILGLPYRET